MREACGSGDRGGCDGIGGAAFLLDCLWGRGTSQLCYQFAPHTTASLPDLLCTPLEMDPSALMA